MDYKVINKFKDTDGRVYEVGKPYPHSGKGTKKRLEELSEVHKKYGVAFIEEVAKTAELHKGEKIVPAKKPKKKE